MPLAIGVNIRTRDFEVDSFIKFWDELLHQTNLSVTVLFLDCDDDELNRRYTETRHRHPLALDRPVIDGIRHERRLVTDLRRRADLVLDTIPTKEAIDAKLADLESDVRINAVGVALIDAYPVSIERVAAWAVSLTERNVTLAPVSAVADRQFLQ